MGYRPHIVTQYQVEYGDALFEYNWKSAEFIEALDKFGFEYFFDGGDDDVSISYKDILEFEPKGFLSVDEIELIKFLKKGIKEAPYAKDDYLKIHWF